MTVVLDSSALVSALIDSGPTGCWAREQLPEKEFPAPHLITVEAANALRRARIRGLVSAGAADRAYGDLLRTPFELYPFHPFAARVWQLRDTVTAYDAWFVALAEALGMPLVTLDLRLANAPGPTCEFVTPPLPA